jgi:hypothetical protein
VRPSDCTDQHQQQRGLDQSVVVPTGFDQPSARALSLMRASKSWNMFENPLHTNLAVKV